MGRALSMRPVATPSFIHLGNCPNLAQFVTGLIVGSGGMNAAFATASAASGGPCSLGTRAPRDGQYRSPRISQPRRQVSFRIDQPRSNLSWRCYY